MFVEEAPRRQTHHQTGRGSYCVGCSLLGVLLGGWSPPQTWRWRETYFSPCGIEPWIRGQGGGVVCGYKVTLNMTLTKAALDLPELWFLHL